MSRKKLFLAFEDNTEGAGEVVEAETIMDTTAAAADAEAEVTSETGDVEELQEAIEDGLEGAGELQSIGEVVAAKVDDGEGLSPDAAAMAEVAIESICNRLGIQLGSNRMPAMENFTSQHRRKEATRITLESSILDTIKKIWVKIKEFAGRVWEKIKQFIANLTKNYGKLGEHLTALKTKADAIGAGAKQEKTDLDNEGLAKFFSVGGKADQGTALLFLGMVGSFAVASSALIESLAKDAKDFKAPELSKELQGGLSKISGLKATGKGSTIEFGPIPGGDVIALTADEGRVSLSFEAGKDHAKTIKAMSKDEIGALLQAAIDQAKHGPDLKEVASKVEKVTKMVGATADKVIKEVSSMKMTDENKGDLKLAGGIAGSVTNIVSKIAGKLPALHFATVRKAGDYASAAITNFKAEDKAAKK